MKELRLTFDNEEFKDLKEFKDGLSWRAFILLMFLHCKEAEKKGHFKIFKQEK